ncbi:MAG: Uma2 family endonuclease [Lewinellaceae bacterium]|nr:Uma2 family endonuclease [Lewinellaceae bacterium]
MVANVSDFADIRLRIRHRSTLLLDDNGMGDDEFFAFCAENPNLRIERNADGKITVMPPTTSETGRYNSKIHIDIGIWNKKTKLGETFDSSTGFKLPNGAERSPDTAWISKERWKAVPMKLKRRFAPIAPDFVLELRSEEQSLTGLRQKMDEYMNCGCRLGWLVDPQNRCTYVYTPDGDTQTVLFEDTLSGGLVMPGLEMQMAEVLGI